MKTNLGKQYSKLPSLPGWPLHLPGNLYGYLLRSAIILSSYPITPLPHHSSPPSTPFIHIFAFNLSSFPPFQISISFHALVSPAVPKPISYRSIFPFFFFFFHISTFIYFSSSPLFHRSVFQLHFSTNSFVPYSINPSLFNFF